MVSTRTRSGSTAAGRRDGVTMCDTAGAKKKQALLAEALALGF